MKLPGTELPAEFVLFGEDPSRVVLSCDASNVSRIQQVAVKYALSAEQIGETVPEHLEIEVGGQVVVSAAMKDLNATYEGALEEALRTEPSPVVGD